MKRKKTNRPPRFEVSIGGKWFKCANGQVSTNGLLDYRLPDGTVGLASPGNWKTR